MNVSGLTRRYAAALFAAAKEADRIDTVESDLGLIGYSLETVPRLGSTLSHPMIPPAKKKQIVTEVFTGKIEDITLDFIKLMIDKRREGIIGEVESDYVRIANEHRGVVPAHVTSAYPLTEEEKKELQAGLSKFTGKKVEIETSEDPDLVGGVVVKIGDTVMDGSVKGYLAALKDRLLGRE